jgi:hypothetical protein
VLMPDEARAAARRAEEAVMRGDRLGLLHGLPISAKDLMAVAGQPYASGSRTMAGNVAAVDAPAVERVKAQGAILIGKTTTSEFGCKPVGDSPLTGHHPPSVGSVKDTRRFQRGGCRFSGGRDHALGSWNRRGRVAQDTCRVHRAGRLQGPLWQGTGLADISHADFGPCRARWPEL